MQSLMTEGTYKVLANLITDWSTLSEDAKDAYVYEALKGIVSQGFYELPDDITVTGYPYFVELYEVGLTKVGA